MKTIIIKNLFLPITLATVVVPANLAEDESYITFVRDYICEQENCDQAEYFCEVR